jgi:hypothetical protein
MNARRTIPLLAILGVVLAGVAALVATTTSGPSRDREKVAVYESRQASPTDFASYEDATRFAERAAGFAPVAPPYVPPGHRVSLIGVGDAPRADSGSTFRRVTTEIESGQGERVITVLATNEPFGFPGDDNENILERLSDDSRLYRQTEDSGAIIYTLITAERGFQVRAAPNRVPEEELRKMVLAFQ